jgi:hypothetical protein
VILGAALYIPFTNVVTYFLFGWTNTWPTYVGLGLGVIAIIVESAVPGILLGKWLMTTGLIRSIYVPDEPVGPSHGWDSPAPS